MAKGSFKIAPSKIDGITAIAADSSHIFGRHTHDQFGIGVIIRGAQKSLSGRGIVEAAAGDIITVNPNEVHDGTPIGDHGRAWYMLYFDTDILAEPMKEIRGGNTRISELKKPVLHDTAATKHFRSLFKSVTNPSDICSEFETQENLHLLLARLVTSHNSADKHSAPSAIELARERIDDDPCSPLSLGELSALGNVSQFQLIRGFSKLTGLTPHAYLIQRRLQYARKMIINGSTLSDAAYASGFADQSHMTRLFVSTYGISPKQYAGVRA